MEARMPTPTQTQTRSRTRPARDVLADSLAARAEELGIDRDTIWFPSTHAVAAWRREGGLLRLDIRDWPATELAR
jgi:hypothetical protein